MQKWEYLNGEGLLGLVFALAFILPFLIVKRLKRLEFSCKVMGTIGLVLIFWFHGATIGIIAIPIAFACSLVGAIVARAFAPKNKF
jgi:hypothetical protein